MFLCCGNRLTFSKKNQDIYMTEYVTTYVIGWNQYKKWTKTYSNVGNKLNHYLGDPVRKRGYVQWSKPKIIHKRRKIK